MWGDEKLAKPTHQDYLARHPKKAKKAAAFQYNARMNKINLNLE